LDNPSLTVALAMAAGIVAQALARHARLPGIVVLLAVGVLMGPDVANLVRPASMGGGLQAFVGFAVAIILFEGGLHMNLKKLRALAKPIRRLVTVGPLVTAAGAAIAAKTFMPWDWMLSILFGTLVIVTGPTVITPLLRRLRIDHGVGLVLEAEGIFVDAVGATIAVVALEVALVPSTESAAAGVLDVALRIGVGAAVGLGGGVILALALRWRNIIPEGLEKLMTLSFAVAVFQVSNAIVHESGITAAIVAGMVLSNSYSHAFDEIVEFKEQLTVLLIATLFVLLAADVRVADILALGMPGLFTVLALMFLVRPLTVAFSSWGTQLTFRERVFMSWLAPRGIVAAAVASLFAISLAEANIPGGTEMRALVFLVIAMTVTIQGLTGGPLASVLGLRRKSNYGYLFLGANQLACTIGGLLRDAGEHVVLLDSNHESCRAAEQQGFEVIHGNGLEPHLLEHADADARAAVIGLTPNETVNFLFTRRVRERYRSPEIFVGLETEASGVTEKMVQEKDFRVLFGGERELAMWLRRIVDNQITIERWDYAVPAEPEPSWKSAPGKAMIPFVHLTGDDGARLVHNHTRLEVGDTVVVGVSVALRKQAYDWLRDNGFVPAATKAEVSEMAESAEPSQADDADKSV